MAYAPFFIKLHAHDRIIMIGGGAIAMAKAETLVTLGAALHVVAPAILPELVALVAHHGGMVTHAPYDKKYIEGARIVIGATDDLALNTQIYNDARALGILANMVDTPHLCDFIFPALVRRGEVQIAISTAGISPSLARLIKRKIEQVLPWNFDALAAWIKERRARVKNHFDHIQGKRLFWDQVITGPIAQEVLEGNHAKAEALFAQALAEQPTAPRAALYLIGAGPGHPDLITVRAAQLLAQADVVLYDRLIAQELLGRYARKEATKIPVGKSAGAHSKTQSEIDALLAAHLRANKIVVRLKGGDPSLYAHAAEELEIARRLGVPAQIVPGITAALGCAAAAGFPLTERDGAQAVRILTLYDETLYDEAFWQSIALAPKETLVFYMTTKKRGFVCDKLMACGLNPTTPLVVIEQGTTPQHAEYEATLGTFQKNYGDHTFITPTLLVVGDVVRWRSRHSWREPSAQKRAWFKAHDRENLHAAE